MLNSGFGTNKDGSASLFMPSPLHSGQQPKGELKENNLGSSLGIEKPQI